jgi:hypothetical protein
MPGKAFCAQKVFSRRFPKKLYQFNARPFNRRRRISVRRRLDNKKKRAVRSLFFIELFSVFKSPKTNIF